jgi:integrase
VPALDIALLVADRFTLTQAQVRQACRAGNWRRSSLLRIRRRGRYPLAVIAKWLGHADASITVRIYAHSQDDARNAAGQSLGAVVTSSGGVVTPS